MSISRSNLIAVSAVLAAALVGCANPEVAALDHAQILAVRTEPAHPVPGQWARVDVLAGDESGNVFETSPTTLDAGGLSTEKMTNGWFVLAPMLTGDAPPVHMLTLGVEIDGEVWEATKSLVVSPTGEPRANPTVTTMQVDGSPVSGASGMLEIARGTKPRLAAIGSSQDLSYAWFSSVGDLSFYRQPEAVLDASEAAEGLVVLVVRDAVGGAGWQILPAVVQ